MSENGNGNDEKNKLKRGPDGRFLPGGPGGPGRGKKSAKPDPTKLSEEEFWDEMEPLIRRDMMSDDVMTRQRAMKIKMMKDEYIKKRKPELEALSVRLSLEVELIRLRKFIDYFGGLEGLETMLRTCPGCNKFPGNPPRDFGIDKHDEDEG